MRYSISKTNFLFGAGIELPDYIKRSKNILSLNSDPWTGQLYEDNWCMFRCLAYHRIQNVSKIESTAKMYLDQWQISEAQKTMPHSMEYFAVDFSHEKSRKTFRGVPSESLPHFEKLFDVSLKIFSMNEDGELTQYYFSTSVHGTEMFLNCYQNHVSYVKDKDLYLKKIQVPCV